MIDLDLTPAQRTVALGALKVMADVDGDRAELESRLLDVVARSLGHDGPLDALPRPDIATLTEFLPSAFHRERLVQGLMVMAIMDGRVTPDEVELAEAWAEALGVHEPRLGNLRQFAEGHIPWLRAELPLRSEMIWGKVHEAWDAEGLRGVIGMLTFPLGLTERPDLQEKYSQLADFPEGSLGRTYHRHMANKGFGMPGVKKAFPEVLVVHDLCHLLAGFDTDATGECEVIAFIAGFIRRDPFWYLFMILTHMHMGVEVFVGDPVAKLQGDPERMARAMFRGMAVNRDLYDRWDFWADFPLPLDEVRRKYNVLPDDQRPIAV